MVTIYYTVPFVWLLLKGGVYSSVAFIPAGSNILAGLSVYRSCLYAWHYAAMTMVTRHGRTLHFS